MKSKQAEAASQALEEIGTLLGLPKEEVIKIFIFRQYARLRDVLKERLHGAANPPAS